MPAGRAPAMRRKRFTKERIIGILKEAEAGGKTTDLCRRHGISELDTCLTRSLSLNPSAFPATR